MISEFIEQLRRHRDLSATQAAAAMEAIMSGQIPPAQIAGFLIALAMKGERPAELVGLATTMRAYATPLERHAGPVCDTCGTGGDGAGTVNISTAAALVVAAAGIPVAKHGNRSVSSRCGSADVLEALGVQVAMSPDTAAYLLDSEGFTFLFAPTFHPAMRHAGPARRDLKVRTAFNLLGPLTNPAQPAHQMVGVPQAELTEVMARALLALGSTRAWVVHSADGLDELSTSGYTKVSEVRNGTVRSFYVHPGEFGIPVSPVEALRGGDAVENASIIRAVLGGARGAVRDVVLFNAGAALMLSDAAPTVTDGIARAADAVDSGAALALLQRVADRSHRGAA
jgi:anthranilate phosphoribosyltransferase